MSTTKYSVEADMHSAPLETGVVGFGQAKFMYDRWKADSEVFNVCMYRHEDGNKVLLSDEEIKL